MSRLAARCDKVFRVEKSLQPRELLSTKKASESEDVTPVEESIFSLGSEKLIEKTMSYIIIDDL